MAIDTVLNPVGMARKLSVDQLTQAIQNGTIPPYVGIPVLQDKIATERRLRAGAAQQQPNQPPIAQQVMQEAQGLAGLQSNLPTQYAGGGIVAFANGGAASMAKMLLGDDEEADDDYTNAVMEAMESIEALRDRASRLQDRGFEMPEAAMPQERGISVPMMSTTESKEGVTVKTGEEPARSVEHRTSSVTKPAGIDQLLAMVEQKESGGRRYDSQGRLLTSPKGAMGEMQVMPGTARDPGFGIRPAREGDPEDIARVGREYFARMLDRYSDPKIAAVAYNWGPGNTDRWLASGADPRKLPEETRKYIQGFAQGGIASFQNGGYSSIFDMAPEEIKERARRLLRMEAARSTFSAAPAAAPAAAPSAAAAPAERSLLSRLGYGIGDFLGSTVKSPLSRGVGLAGLFTPSTTNEGEQAELARRRAMPPTIDVPAGQLLREFPAVPPEPGVPRMPPGGSAAQTYRHTSGPALGEAQAYEAGREFTVGIPEEDEAVRANIAALASQKPEGTAPAAKEPSEQADGFAELRKYIQGGREELKKQKEVDNYMALLQAGLGMLGGTSPFAAANIGRGAAQGIQAYQEAARGRAAEEKALLSAQLGLERYGALGALQKEQMLTRKQLSEAETQRKKEADVARAEQGKASLEERRRKNIGDQLNEIKRLVQQQALAQYKGTILPEQKDQIFAQAEADLLKMPEYRKLYQQYYGFEPAGPRGTTLQWNQLK